jgi:hypothetical protein
MGMTGFSGLQRLIYASRWSDPTRMDVPELVADIVARSSQNNRLRGVSGLLLFHRGWFLQVLEGPLEAVDDAFDRIRRDDRHTDIRVVADLPIAARAFGDWTMSAERLDEVAAGELDQLGLSQDFDPAALDPSSAISLLLAARAAHIRSAPQADLAERAA